MNFHPGTFSKKDIDYKQIIRIKNNLIYGGVEVVVELLQPVCSGVYQIIQIKNNLIHVGADEVVDEQFLLGF
jgi:N-acetyl-beta-hexosaminidase